MNCVFGLYDKSPHSRTISHPDKALKMPPKELKKGGKPAQVKGACDLALEENKEFVKTFFSAEGAEPIYGYRVASTEGIEPERCTAKAGTQGYNGSCIVNTYMSFGTATDVSIPVEGGSSVIVPERFLKQKGNCVHPQLFKAGDVVLCKAGRVEKHVDVGFMTAVGVRSWSEVGAWIPAEKVERAIKEGRLKIWGTGEK